jgi:hypothetical protein
MNRKEPTMIANIAAYLATVAALVYGTVAVGRSHLPH